MCIQDTWTCPCAAVDGPFWMIWTPGAHKPNETQAWELPLGTFLFKVHLHANFAFRFVFLQKLASPIWRFLRFVIAIAVAHSRSRAISETRQCNALLRFQGAMENRRQLRFRVAICFELHCMTIIYIYVLRIGKSFPGMKSDSLWECLVWARFQTNCIACSSVSASIPTTLHDFQIRLGFQIHYVKSPGTLTTHAPLIMWPPSIKVQAGQNHLFYSVSWRFTPLIKGASLHPLNWAGMGCQGWMVCSWKTNTRSTGRTQYLDTVLYPCGRKCWHT